ncbi:MAG TPA: KEOPS complex kinase/ATPase Bud32 [archaeon]|jgi:N6-L-threonylcarbamoyladenine synthase/protein kinase Bud32|nr:KEOPS complex kinase/ATPase Bud32 [archaeon]
MKMQEMSIGAEAKIYKTTIIEEETIIKQRISKKYRNPILDEKINKTRNKKEAGLLKKCKQLKINTPYIYYIGKTTIVQQYIKNDSNYKPHLMEIGKTIAKMHNNNIIHGDLNLKNIIINNKKIYIIDFGLGYISNKIEDKATDLLVFKKTLLSKEETEKYWEKILKGYIKETNEKNTIPQIKKIEERGRYL